MMRLGIRAKLIAMMVLSGVLPLLAVLCAGIFVGGRYRKASVGNRFLATATAEASLLRTTLREDILAVEAHLREPTVIDALTAGPAKRMSDERLAELDANWKTLPADSPIRQRVLASQAAKLLGHFQRTTGRCEEFFITDSFGQLVAASNMTSDFYQADESWWQSAYADGVGKVCISPIRRDESSNVWGLEICMPIYADRDGRREAVGVAKAVMDVSSWATGTMAQSGEFSVKPMLVDDAGQVLFAADIEPLSQVLADWRPAVATEIDGWRVVGADLQAYAAVGADRIDAAGPIDAPRWFVVVQLPADEALGSVYWLGLVVLLVGLGVVAGVFAVGLHLAQHGVVKPLARLRKATARVAAGDLDNAMVAEGRKIATDDEIGQLASDFDRMVTAVAASQRMLEEANETKSRFIHVAGHELRTPISYIIAMTSLLTKSEIDPSLHASLAKLGDKARRLDKVVTDMFRVAEEGDLAPSLKYTTFSAAELVMAVAEEFRPFADKRRLRILIEEVEGAPAIKADRAKLHDALAHLVTNAIKFTPDGRVIKMSIQRQIGGRVALRVRDQGRGISEAELPHIFEPFWSGPDLLAHSSGELGHQKRGAGLGLVIARHFVRLHGGRIQVANSEHGCVFSIIVPTTPEADEEADG